MRIFALVFALQAQDEETLPPDSWFIQGKGVELKQNEDGSLMRRDERMRLDPAPGPLFAAWSHRDRGLVTVDKKGAVSLYEPAKDSWKRVAHHSPPVEAHTEAVRITRVYGLVYVLWTDVQHKKRLDADQAKRQEYADRYERLALREQAKSWHAIPTIDPNELLLGGCYRPTEKGLRLSVAEGRWLDLELGGPPAEPFRSGPSDTLAQSVFYFPKQGGVCLTGSGWALWTNDGLGVKQFSTEGIDPGWWADPTVEGDEIFVHSRTGPGGMSYRLDLASGKLVAR
jgi:hypothetical protein